MRETVAEIAIAFALLASAGCVKININEERFHTPNVVRGYPPADAGIAKRNEQVLTMPLPNRLGVRPQPGAEVPHPGRLYDPAIEPDRNAAPGRDTLDENRIRNKDEWQFNQPDKEDGPPHDGPPRLCVAMSGGGVRSASFNLGVLSALHKNGILGQVDVLSAVSGGAYILSWYYMQHYNFKDEDRTALDKRLFDVNGPLQDHLSDTATVFNELGYLGLGVLNTLMIPVNFLFNGIFGWHLNTTPGRAMYEQRLQSMFHSKVSEKREVSPPPTIGFDELGTRVRAKRLPYFVINTTALIEDTSEHLGAPLYNSIFEFTPLFFGSEALGRNRYDGRLPLFPVSFARAVSISGAALDGTKAIAGPTQRTLWSILNQDLGYYLNNPAVSRESRSNHRALPFPLYYFHHYPRDLSGTDIYLSDGGHSENLGAYALVRRLCEKIIVIDAEHDPNFEFEAYYLLKRGLRRDMNVDLGVPDIEKVAQGEVSLREARIDAAIRRDGPEPDPAATVRREGLPPDHWLPALKTRDLLASSRWKDVAKKPVMKGSVACLPYPGRPNAHLSVAYVKLAYWRGESDCSAVDAYFTGCAGTGASENDCWKNLENRAGLSGQALEYAINADNAGLTSREQGNIRPDYSRLYFCRTRETSELRTSRYTRLSHFPQQPTTDQDFDEWQFKAYRHLGFKIADENMKSQADLESEPVAGCSAK